MQTESCVTGAPDSDRVLVLKESTVSWRFKGAQRSKSNSVESAFWNSGKWLSYFKEGLDCPPNSGLNMCDVCALCPCVHTRASLHTSSFRKNVFLGRGGEEGGRPDCFFLLMFFWCKCKQNPTLHRL